MLKTYDISIPGHPERKRESGDTSCFDCLPDPVILEIFKFLQVEEDDVSKVVKKDFSEVVKQLTSVCRRWRKLAFDCGLWNSLCCHSRHLRSVVSFLDRIDTRPGVEILELGWSRSFAFQIPPVSPTRNDSTSSTSPTATQQRVIPDYIVEQSSLISQKIGWSLKSLSLTLCGGSHAAEALPVIIRGLREHCRQLTDLQVFILAPRLDADIAALFFEEIVFLRPRLRSFTWKETMPGQGTALQFHRALLQGAFDELSSLELHVTGWNDYMNQGLSEHCTRLREITLHTGQVFFNEVEAPLPGQTLSVLVRHLRLLERVKLGPNCTSDEDIETLSRSHPKLQELSLEHSQALVTPAFASLPTLSRLSLHSNVQSVSCDHCPSLSHFRVTSLSLSHVSLHNLNALQYVGIRASRRQTTVRIDVRDCPLIQILKVEMAPGRSSRRSTGSAANSNSNSAVDSERSVQIFCEGCPNLRTMAVPIEALAYVSFFPHSLRKLEVHGPSRAVIPWAELNAACPLLRAVQLKIANDIVKNLIPGLRE
mmetsp:Transcript_25356/g.43800  ORF Transcript_25356/g.43800 Transcript_25356/m.43800 type:complete len:538 (+) Transcript_25356:88-1701(+)|eukprot:CAMPEP_0196668336 /NCGR_PEP_ID=MMETSP1086-20130531/65070_1 /TAXON_ID=77921 /ORGANISM="Cyanoptyche  gloeocystis , Strain SAG4.97" /LENGTH=537 /DNA_ID=CAMNT_0042005737 /DNA_START=88 /DNA_END=1701 /DNA_ORIENTATION=-